MKTERIWYVLLWFVLLVLITLLSWTLVNDEIKISVWKQESVSSVDFEFRNITWDLYFWPDLKYEEYRNIINKLDSDVYIYMYTLSYAKITNLLKKLWEWWNDVRLILEDSRYSSDNSDFDKIKNKLEKSHVKIKTDSQMWTNYIHAKTLIYDDMFIIQSANFTYSTFNSNREIFFVSRDSLIRESLKNIYLKDWEWEKIEKSDIPDNLLVCNIDCRSKIETLLKSAQHSIYIDTQYVDDKAIIDILTDKKDKLDLKVIVGINQKIPYLKYLEGNYKIFDKYYNHIKSILIDDKYLIVSSINLSENSMDNNREIGIVITDHELIQKFKNKFEKDWAL